MVWGSEIGYGTTTVLSQETRCLKLTHERQSVRAYEGLSNYMHGQQELVLQHLTFHLVLVLDGISVGSCGGKRWYYLERHFIEWKATI